METMFWTQGKGSYKHFCKNIGFKRLETTGRFPNSTRVLDGMRNVKKAKTISFRRQIEGEGLEADVGILPEAEKCLRCGLVACWRWLLSRCASLEASASHNFNQKIHLLRYLQSNGHHAFDSNFWMCTWSSKIREFPYNLRVFGVC